MHLHEWGFAKNEFKSYILIDFAHTSKAIIDLFDEVQLLPKARQAIKYLVADGRYKYIETGSLLSIKKNTKDYKWEKGIHYIPVYMVPFF